ncbi:MAG: carboxypeptidase M32 [Verrucomicrobiota bacterium]|nr:carboxypeptidase M32 [Verrucomicrobiota bacterium]
MVEHTQKPVSLRFGKLATLSKEIHTWQSILSLLHWDQETYLPQGGIVPRSEQIAQLSHLIHQKRTAPAFRRELGEWVDLKTGRIKKKGLSFRERSALAEWHRDWLRDTRLPASFVKKFSELTAQASNVWAEAKRQNNFSLFAPFLEKIVAYNQKKAELLGFEKHPYEALLLTYEPSLSARAIEKIFAELEKGLRPLLNSLLDAISPDTSFLEKRVGDDKQWALGELLASKLPLDPSYSRLDRSVHPFSTAMHPQDSRITTRILPNRFLSNLLAILHEAGHSLYEMGLPAEEFGTPLGEAVSLSIHESQSRFWETFIGLSLPFWKFFYPFVQEAIPHLQKVPLLAFYRGIHRVHPSFIRIEADEVTYPLHILLRFDLEKRLIDGTLRVNDLPEAWNQKMHSLLGITPSHAGEGCLQDIHWSLGSFGYFPTYALGNLFAAQFFQTFTKEHRDWEKRVEKGDLLFIRDWLRKNIHSLGKTYSGEELLERVTGAPLSAKPYCAYLQAKYKNL